MERRNRGYYGRTRMDRNQLLPLPISISTPFWADSRATSRRNASPTTTVASGRIITQRKIRIISSNSSSSNSNINIFS